MSDSVTIGALASLALSMASEAALKGVVGAGVKDAYKALKNKIAHWASGDLEALEKNPSSVARRAVIAETIDELSDDEKMSVKTLADALTEALKQSAAPGPIGIDVGTLEAARIKLDGMTVHTGGGIQAQTIKAQEDFELKNLTVGDTPGKAAQ